MALMMVQHLSGGAWGIFRRIFEASSRTLPLMLVLFLPVVLGIQALYPWAHADLVQSIEVLRHRQPYLNATFWIIRAAVYFAGWIAISMTLNRWSQRQDSGEVGVNLPIQKLCGFGLVSRMMAKLRSSRPLLKELNRGGSRLGRGWPRSAPKGRPRNPGEPKPPRL